jgi:hypothetical protein
MQKKYDDVVSIRQLHILSRACPQIGLPRTSAGASLSDWKDEHICTRTAFFCRLRENRGLKSRWLVEGLHCSGRCVGAETGVVMLMFLNHVLAEIAAPRRAKGGELSHDDVRAAIMRGAVERARPKLMTVVAIMAGLLPILWSSGTGSEIMQRIAVGDAIL